MQSGPAQPALLKWTDPSRRPAVFRKSAGARHTWRPFIRVPLEDRPLLSSALFPPTPEARRLAVSVASPLATPLGGSTKIPVGD